MREPLYHPNNEREALPMDAPEADIVVNDALVRRLLAEQHPDLPGPLRLVANGWDNAVYRLGVDLAVRIPRRRIAVPLIEHEQRWLPTFAQRSPVAVPAPVRVGTSSAAFPHPWSIVPWFPGRSAADLPPADRVGLAVALAEFMDRIAVDAPDDAPVNPVRGVPLAVRAASVRERLERVANPALTAAFEDALAAPAWRGQCLWMHGDLHPGNLVVGSDGSLAAVIDFGDLGRGDPATDLSTAWLCFDAAGAKAFRERLAQLRDVDEATWRRARGWAIVMGTAVVESTSGDGPITRMGRDALSRVLEEW